MSIKSASDIHVNINLVHELVDLSELHPVGVPPLKLDIAYARADNFMGRPVYTLAKAFLIQKVAEDLLSVHRVLEREGYGLLIFDGYRPWSVTKYFWDHTDEQMHEYLADPATGSVHNRGCAVDLSMYELKTGKAVEMPSGFDEMNEKAHVAYEGGTAEARALRDLLQKTMKTHHFTGIKNEWWHFNHVTAKEHPIMNFSFEEILQARQSLHHKRES